MPPKRKSREVFTEQQLQMLITIRDLSRLHKVPPTYDEVAAPLGITKATARQTILRLIRKGLLFREPWRERNVKVTRAGHRVIAANKID